MYPVDTIAAVQGAHDAYADGKISKELHDSLVRLFYLASEPGPVERMELNYDIILAFLSKLKDIPHYQLAALWEYLGRSLANGILQGDNNHQCSGKNKEKK